MSEITLYHKPRCSKSRQTLALLQGRGIEPEIIEYLKTPPDTAAILSTEDNDAALFAAMALNPILIERSIIVAGEDARIERPPEDVFDIL